MVVSNTNKGLAMPPTKRNDIILATVELVAEKGFHGASTAKIAARADVAEVTVFRIFKAKKLLLEATFDEILADCTASVCKGHDITLPLKERFFALCHGYCSYLMAKPESMNFLEQYLHSAEGWAKRPDMVHESSADFHKHPLISLLTQGRESGEIKNLPMPILVGLIAGTLFNLERLKSLKKIAHSEKLQQEAVQACWDGIAG